MRKALSCAVQKTPKHFPHTRRGAQMMPRVTQRGEYCQRPLSFFAVSSPSVMNANSRLRGQEGRKGDAPPLTACALCCVAGVKHVFLFLPTPSAQAGRNLVQPTRRRRARSLRRISRHGTRSERSSNAARRVTRDTGNNGRVAWRQAGFRAQMTIRARPF